MIKNSNKLNPKYLFLLFILLTSGVIIYKSLSQYLNQKYESKNSEDEISDKVSEESKINFNVSRDCYIDTFSTNNYKPIENIPNEMNNPKFWISNYKNSSSLVMDYDKVKDLNSKILENNLGVYDLKNYSMPSKEEISNSIKEYAVNITKYYNDNKTKYTSKDETVLKDNLNLNSISSPTVPQYGLTLTKANIRSYPTDSGAYKTSDSIFMDMFQQSSLEINEPVAILHESLDKKWYFIQGYNYKGWCSSSNIGKIKNKDDLFNYLENNKFIMATGNHINAYSLDDNIKYSYNMGSKIFLYENNNETKDISQEIVNNNYIIKIPIKDENDNLIFKIGKLSFSEDTNYGYLSYTIENVLLQGFKSLGEKYNWGNKFNGRDCSGYISSIYNTMGFRLPRDTDPMEKIPSISLKLTGNKEKQIENLLPGSLLFMNNHVMMYLGNYTGSNYMIHAFRNTGDGISVNQVGVTSTKLPYNTSNSFLDKCSSVLTLK